MNEILESACTSLEVVIDNTFYFVFRFSSDKVRQWPCIVGAMGLIFMIGGQEGGVEDVMDGPGYGELELIGDR